MPVTGGAGVVGEPVGGTGKAVAEVERDQLGLVRIADQVRAIARRAGGEALLERGRRERGCLVDRDRAGVEHAVSRAGDRAVERVANRCARRRRPERDGERPGGLARSRVHPGGAGRGEHRPGRARRTGRRGPRLQTSSWGCRWSPGSTTGPVAVRPRGRSRNHSASAGRNRTRAPPRRRESREAPRNGSSGRACRSGKVNSLQSPAGGSGRDHAEDHISLRRRAI